LFNYDVSQRGFIAITLTLIVLIASRFLPQNPENKSKSDSKHSLFLMVLWVFLDSALFESLSRDVSISIWRDGFTLEIALFHIIGVVCALYFKIEKNQKELFIITLFALSYLILFFKRRIYFIPYLSFCNIILQCSDIANN
jgi:hypothetical protein